MYLIKFCVFVFKYRRLESLDNPSRPPITVYRQDSRIQKLKEGLKERDREIADRLEKLKEERKKQPVPTEEEMARRLALLKNEDPDRMAALAANKKVVSKLNVVFHYYSLKSVLALRRYCHIIKCLFSFYEVHWYTLSSHISG